MERRRFIEVIAGGLLAAPLASEAPASSPSGVAEQLTAEARAANVELQLVALRNPNNIQQAFAEFRRGIRGV
jgi:hypothetical protein